MPAAAVYFHDPDGHQLEYLAMLPGPARPEVGIVSWSQWTSADSDRLAIEAYEGRRDELRALFAEAEDSPEQLDSYFHEGVVFVARIGEAVVGHLQLADDVDADASEIKNMAVDASHRRRGIGRALIDEAIEVARARGRSTLAVATAAADIGNLRFYQRAGFRLRRVERDAFTTLSGYRSGIDVDGIELRDRVWLDLDLEAPPR
jgi:GNAT superfamily N-acetyltransferase